MQRKLQFYDPFWSTKQRRWCPGVSASLLTEEGFTALCSRQLVAKLVQNYRDGTDPTAKTHLPAICWNGFSTTGKRSAAAMVSTGLYMADIDHTTLPPKEVYIALQKRYDSYLKRALLAAHVTPSGQGLRLVFDAHDDDNDYTTVVDKLAAVNALLHLDEYGTFDTAVKDLSRLSFVVPEEDWLYIDRQRLFHPDYEPVVLSGALPAAAAVVAAKTAAKAEAAEAEDTQPGAHAGAKYRGHLLTDIVARYLQVNGTPGEGETHNYYNRMVKEFRHIADNDPEVLADVLPLFGRPRSVRLSQCQSICRTNTMALLPPSFYAFLAANNFIDGACAVAGSTAEQEMELPPLPEQLPPVFAEWLAIAPRDFRLPVVNALLPILGTLTSYVRAPYFYDGVDQSTEFFSIIYAPSGAGKSFVKRLLTMTHLLAERDKMNIVREALYNDTEKRRGANKELPEYPKTSVRLAPAKMSETEFLVKMSNTDGNHMFTYCAEIDEWIKGVRAAGGNKDDMIRIAWDNGEYGQMFRSANSYRGKTRLFWNVLMTGTKDQMDRYFANVSNGLVQRCSFVPIMNQRFARVPHWGEFTAQQQDTIDAFVLRCDRCTYLQPLDYSGDCTTVGAEDYDKLVPWRFAFRNKQHIDMLWLQPTIDQFLEEQLRIAAIEQNDARDSWRRRVAVRGFRLGLLCTQCYDRPELTEGERETIATFVNWWMHCDITLSLQPFEEKFNEVSSSECVRTTRRTPLYDRLPAEFTRDELELLQRKEGRTTPTKNVLHTWRRNGLIELVSEQEQRYRKQ